MIKKILLTGFGLTAALLMSGNASAAIAGTAHDFSGGGGNVCSGCHTPHNSSASTAGPLWSAATSNGTYTMYASPSIDMAIDGVPNGASTACLSCHDGVNGEFGAGSTKNLGVDLGNDHPISIEYDPTMLGQSTEFKTVTSVEGVGLRLFGAANKVECATCHDVHANDVSGALERNLVGGVDMCTACHIK